MAFRHEWKHLLHPAEAWEVGKRLQALLQRDPYGGARGRYTVRSLYFDNLEDKALREKLDGVNRREKFRIRYYNGDTAHIRLEKKSKVNGLCGKRAAALSREEAQALVEGRLAWMPGAEGRPLVQELYAKMRTQGIRPKTIVDYDREPFVYGPGHVRVTLDRDVRTGLRCVDFLDGGCVTVPAGEGLVVLEVKWDAYLPSLVRDAVQMGRGHGAFSKYAACRIYG